MTTELSYQEIEDYLNEITVAKKFVLIGSCCYVLNHPTQEQIFLSRIIYKEQYTKAKEANFPTVEEAEDMVKERGLFTPEDEAKIADIRSKIEGQKKVLEKTTRVPAKRQRLVSIIKRLEREVQEVLRKKDQFIINTCEARARESQYLYLCRLNVYSFDGELLWKTKEDFEDDKNYGVQTSIYNQYVRIIGGISTETIRAIARSTLFKIKYQNSLKASTPLFSRAASEYTVDMLNLCYWGAFYQSINEMMPEDIPPDYIIEDDDALDAYMETLYKEKSNERASRRGSKQSSSKIKSAWDSQEVVVMKSNELYEDVEYTKSKQKDTESSDVKIKNKESERKIQRKV
jgi:hypothetical protein